MGYAHAVTSTRLVVLLYVEVESAAHYVGSILHLQVE